MELTNDDGIINRIESLRKVCECNKCKLTLLHGLNYVISDNQTWCPGTAARVQHIPRVDLRPVFHKLWREPVKWQWVGSDRIPLESQLSELVKHELFSKRQERS